MAKFELGDGLKKIVLAGIGATAITGEKAQEILNQLVEKGELTVEQGKALNEELKHKAKETKDSKKKPEEEKKEDAKADVAEILNGMSADQLEQLKTLLEAVKKPAGDTEEKGSAEEEKTEE